jgi:hypothetical protein
MSPTSKRIEQPVSKWPRLDVVDGGQAVRLSGTYRAPSAWWSEAFPILMLLASPFLLPLSCSAVGTARYGSWDNMPAEAVVYFTGGFIVAMFLFVAVCEQLGARRQLRVKVSPDAIEIDGRTYARAEGLNHFSIEEHEKAFDEERAIRRGHGGRIYLDAMQVVMRYGEKRVPIAAFGKRDVRKAEALLLRLQMLNKGLEQLLGTAPGERDEFGRERPIR